MPYPNEHACRLNDPGKYDRFARKNCEQKHENKCIDVIYGIKNNKTEIQALRYPKKAWDVADARAHCKTNKGSFEAAAVESEEAMYEMSVKDASGQMRCKVVSGAELTDWFKAHVDAEGAVTEEVALFGAALFKAKDGAADTVDWVMSDFTLDRDKERIDPSGWDLKQYKKNPVVLWSHDVMRPAIGRVVSPRVSNGALRGKVQFAPKEIDEFAWQVGEKVKAGFLSAGSVGFRPTKVEIVDPEQEPKEEARVIIRKAELFEFSVCNVPANPAARPVEPAEPGKAEEPGEIEKTLIEDAVEEIAAAEVKLEELEPIDEGTITTSASTTDEPMYMQMPLMATQEDVAKIMARLDELSEKLAEIADQMEGAISAETFDAIVTDQIQKASREKSYLHDLFQDRGSRRETSVTRETSGLEGLFGSKTDARGDKTNG